MGKFTDQQAAMMDVQFEAWDVEREMALHIFAVQGKCIGCLNPDKFINHEHLCDHCQDMDDSTEGAFLALIKPDPKK